MIQAHQGDGISDRFGIDDTIDDLVGPHEHPVRVIEHLFELGERGIDAANIVLAGFSQGGGVAINTALRYPRRLAGVIGLSTWVPRIDSLESERNPANNEIPMFLAHGSMDPMVPEEHGKASADRIEALGYPVTWHSYPMMHGVCPEEIVHIREWLAAQLGSGGDCV